MYKAVIFDLDGTLLDTIEDITDSMNASLRSLGHLDFPIDAYKYFVGRGVDELIVSAIEAGGIDPQEFTAIKAGYLKEYAIRKSMKTKPYPGMINLLQKLIKAGIKVCILSNKPHFQTEAVVETYFSNVDFDIVFGKKPEYPIKPDPSSANAITQLLGIDIAEILYVGDTNTDMETAINAGFDSVGVLWGFRNKQELLNANATYIVSQANQIYDIVKGDNRDYLAARSV